jgi:hypothetical protein
MNRALSVCALLVLAVTNCIGASDTPGSRLVFVFEPYAFDVGVAGGLAQGLLEADERYTVTLVNEVEGDSENEAGFWDFVGDRRGSDCARACGD